MGPPVTTFSILGPQWGPKIEKVQKILLLLSKAIILEAANKKIFNYIPETYEDKRGRVIKFSKIGGLYSKIYHNVLQGKN